MAAGRMAVRVLADDRPGEEFCNVEPDLEDVYLVALRESTTVDCSAG